MAILVQQKNTVSKVGAPFIKAGIKIPNKVAKVKSKVRRDLAPVFPPTSKGVRINREIS